MNNNVLPLLPRVQFLSGQVVAITAADRGFGRVMAQGFAEAGATVVLVGKLGEQLASYASHIEERGGTAIPMQADVSVPLDWKQTRNRIVEIFGGLDGVVHAADKRAGAKPNSANAFDDAISVNKRVEEKPDLLNEAEVMDLLHANFKSSLVVVEHLRREAPETWVTIVGPHLDEGGLYGHTLRGGLGGLLMGAKEKAFRLNLVVPSRSPCGEDEKDLGVVNTVLSLAMPSMRHVTGVTFEVDLPAPLFGASAELTPEERANLLSVELG